MKDYYAILEVNENASKETIDKVYKLMVKKYHPDLQEGDKKLQHEEKLKEINEAYETLTNEDKKIVYDEDYIKANWEDATEEGIKERIWQDIKEINQTLVTYKHIKHIIVTNEEMIKTTTAKVKRHEEIKTVNHFNSTPVGYRYQISFTIYVDGNLSTFESHDIANRLEKEIDKEIKEIYLTVIHVNPMEMKEKKKDK